MLILSGSISTPKLARKLIMTTEANVLISSGLPGGSRQKNGRVRVR